MRRLMDNENPWKPSIPAVGSERAVSERGVSENLGWLNMSTRGLG